MKKLTKKALLEHLARSEKEDIIKEIVTLYDRFANVKEFYKSELSGNDSPLLSTYKKKISNAYSAANPSERRTNMNVNRLIANFKKVSIYKEDVADLMLHRVECGVEAFTRNNKRSAVFYGCIVNSFKDAFDIIIAENLINEFRPRIAEVIKKSGEMKYEIRKAMEGIVSEL